MKYFLDTEFAEKPCTIELISLGIVAEDGREWYAENLNFNPDNANDWVKENVLAHLEGGWTEIPLVDFKDEILSFIGTDTPEFWGYYADYDWVVFCWLFGTMIDLPKGWPMYCRDIKQLADSLGNPQLPVQYTKEHHALSDALWNKRAYEFLTGVKNVQ